MKKLEMNNYESPLFRVYEIQVKKAVLGASTGNPDPDNEDDTDNWGF